MYTSVDFETGMMPYSICGERYIVVANVFFMDDRIYAWIYNYCLSALLLFSDDFVLDIKVKSLVTTTNTLFFAEWDHPSLAGFLHYRTELMVNETMVHSNNISHPYSYCFIDEYESPFILFVYAFDLCGGKEIGSINEDFPGKTISYMCSF